VNQDTDPTPTDRSVGDHGTSVSGLIAATDGNDQGGRGVAPQAELVGFNYITSQSQQLTSDEIASLGGSTSEPNSSTVDVFNMSYGLNLTEDYPLDEQSLLYLQIQDGFLNGRSGKGALYVKSAGNGYLDYDNASCSMANAMGLPCQNANMSPYMVTPYTLVVGALNASGERSSYSTPGANLWVSAFGGEFGYSGDFTFSSNHYLDCSGSPQSCEPAMVTTDLMGCDSGYSQSYIDDFNSGHHAPPNPFEDNSTGLNPGCNYTSTFNGTSSAAPVLSGVIALLLEANADLTARQVKHILAKTARQVDPNQAGITVSLNQSYQAEQGWAINQAGYPFHNWYGFGAVDVDAALDEATSPALKSFTSLQTCAWQESNALGTAIPDKSTTGASSALSISDQLTFLEGVQVRVSATHSYTGDLGIELTSPAGTRSILFNVNNGFSSNTDLDNMTLLSNAFYGESSVGNWTLTVIDGASSDNGTLDSWALRVLGEGNCAP
jgi:subtilisin-like proprotein convertase family protein